MRPRHPAPLTPHAASSLRSASICNSFRCNTCEPLVTVDSKRLTQALSPLESALTSHSQLIENTPTLSPLDATLTRFRAVTPLEATLTKKGRGRGSPAVVAAVAFSAGQPNNESCSRPLGQTIFHFRVSNFAFRITRLLCQKPSLFPPFALL